MKQILIIFGLLISVTTFAQSPRIKLNQITKDTIKGSVLISNPTDSGMVYSRDFYIAYGADTLLILYGDTIGGVGGGVNSIVVDPVTLNGNGTTASPLSVDTATVISTIQGLVDSLLNYVTTNTTQSISGAKTFTSDLDIDAKIALNAGDDNVVIGDGAGGSLVSNQTFGNVLIGTNAGALINSGDFNTAVGSNALYLNTSGSNNIANGYGALYSDTSGSNNIANGFIALYSNTSGSNNIANGYAALYSNKTGGNNIANGYEALYLNTSGNYNIAYGFRPLYNLSSGSNNQAFGSEAGRYYGSGSDSLKNANGSLFFGSNTRASANGNSNEIVIGTDAIGNGSNSVTIGNNGTIGTATTKTILNGNVGIGTTSPSGLYRLTLNGSSTNTGGIVIKQSGTDVMYMGNITVANTTDFEFWNPRNGYTRFATNNIERMRIDASGNVGIGTSPSEKLDVNGNGRFRSIGSGASAGALHYTSTGVLTTNTSDVRLKTNLQPLENTLNKLLGINTYTFNWINETDRVDLGMVAQEVEQIFPNLVFTNSVDGYKGIHYDKFSSILTKAIQEQQAIIETQASEIDQLKTLITDLTNRLIILENK